MVSPIINQYINQTNISVIPTVIQGILDHKADEITAIDGDFEEIEPSDSKDLQGVADGNL